MMIHLKRVSSMVIVFIESFPDESAEFLKDADFE